MSDRPIIDAFFDEATFTVTYLVSDPASGRAAIVDPVRDYDHKSGRASTVSADRVLAKATERGIKVDWILETHAHADHLTAAPHLRVKTGAQVVIGEHIREVQKIFKEVFNASDVSGDGREFDRLVRDGDRLALGTLEIEVMHLPGHTPADVAYRIGDAVFVGDTIFMPDYGTARADFPGGDAAQLYRSIRRLLSLPPETRLFMCHDYKAPGREHYAWQTTVADERAHNTTSMMDAAKPSSLPFARSATPASRHLCCCCRRCKSISAPDTFPRPTRTASAICAFPCGSLPDSRVAELASCIALR